MTNQINENEIDIFSVIILFIIFSLMPNRIINTQTITLQWRHNGHDSVSNHQPHDCLLNINSDADQRKHQNLRVTGLCAGNSPGTGEFPVQMASYQVNAQPLFEVRLADWPRTPFGVCANLLRDRCSCRSYNSKCNLWKSWTLKLTSEFSHAHLTIFSTVWDTCWFYQDHASRRNAKLQKIYQYFVG